MIDRKYILRCVVCGASVKTESKDRTCYKCNGKMKLIEVVEKKW